MNSRTRVSSMQLKTTKMTEKQELVPSAELSELEPKKSFTCTFLKADQLLRNFAVAGVLLLTVVAIKNTDTPKAQSVFQTIEQNAGMEWDESIGKLSFVDGLVPEALQCVWNERPAVSVFSPVDGDTIHQWTQQEPYTAVFSLISDVRAAADGEVMSVSHGMEEERIVRVRHEDGTESIYGNLADCYVQSGDYVMAGEIFAKTEEHKPLIFELRKDGKSLNPDGLLRPFED